MDTPRWAQLLITAFPKLASEDFEVAERPSEQYNCIAYTAGDTSKWWDHNKNHYWPAHATRSNSIESLVEVFAGLGFEPCPDGRVEEGYQKVALYEEQGEWTHAALQMPNGRWRSKMGQGPVIEHQNPESLSDGPYGNVAFYMRRVVSAAC